MPGDRGIDRREPPRATAEPEQTRTPVARPRRLLNAPRILLAGVAVFVVVLTAVSWLRVLELTAATWDLGIYQQGLWSAAHGGPFYESPDWETGGFGSFLQVHSAFVLYLVAPLYAAVPSPATLFAVQASVVALAALPLYGLVRDLGGSSRRALVAAALYLTSALTLGSTLYDFHIEAFLPVETLTLVFLWNRGWYGRAAIVAGLGYVTMEAAPLLAASVALFFLVGAVVEGPDRGPAVPAGKIAWLLGRLKERRALAAASLLVGSIAVYYVLLAARLHLLGDLGGFPAFPVHENGYVIGGTPTALGLSFAGLAAGFYQKLVYWITVFALVLFLPFRAPRSLLMVLPWMIFTFLSADTNYAELGFQYGFLVTSGLFPAVAWGLVRLARPVVPFERASPAVGRPRRAAWVRAIPAVVVVVVISANLLASPLDPLAQGGGPGSAYYLSYQVPAGYGDAARLAGLVPHGAPVLASDVLFPLVANNLHAYSLFWGTNPYLVLPFNASDPPDYAFVAESRLAAVPYWLGFELYHPNVFGLRGLAWSTPAGAVFLFERGYSGPALELGPAPAQSLSVSPPALAIGPAGWLIDVPGTPAGTIIATLPYASGELWSSPGWNLPPGQYRFTFWVKTWPTDPAAPPAASTPVLEVDANPFAAGGGVAETFTFGELAHDVFAPVTLTINLTAPVMYVVVRGFASTYAASVGISELTMDVVP